MDEDLAAINTSTRNQKIRDFFVKFKSYLISLFVIIILIIFGYFIYSDIQKKIRLI